MVTAAVALTREVGGPRRLKGTTCGLYGAGLDAAGDLGLGTGDGSGGWRDILRGVDGVGVLICATILPVSLRIDKHSVN